MEEIWPGKKSMMGHWDTKNLESSIVIRRSLSNANASRALLHEYIHQLAWFRTGDGDGDHSDPRLFSCPGSAEAIAIEILELQNAYKSAYRCAAKSKQ